MALGSDSVANGGNGVGSQNGGNGGIALNGGVADGASGSTNSNVNAGTSGNANGNEQVRSVAINGGHTHQGCTDAIGSMCFNPS